MTLLDGITSRLIDTDRLTVNILERAGDDPATAPEQTVVLVHGNVSSSLFWQELMQDLPSDLRVIAIDLRGFGETESMPVDATRGVRDFSDDVRSALVALGMSLAEYDLKAEWKVSLAIVIPKLLILPLIVFGLARLLGLPALETQVIVLLASIGQGANVFLMARQFRAVEGGMAGALIISTASSALTTPLLLALTSSGRI